MLSAVDCEAITDTQWNVLFGGSLLWWLELKYMFEIHLLSPSHHDKVQQKYNHIAEFNAFDLLLKRIEIKNAACECSFPRNLSQTASQR